MKKIPKRLKQNPVLESIAEVRFISSLPPETIIGLVYENVKDKFGEPKSLPILQLPAALREKDPKLKYQACYRFEKPGNVLLVGPYIIALSTAPYSDWPATTPLLSELLTKFHKIKLLQSVERIGLRYVNFFENLNIFNHITLSIEINEQSIAERSIVLRTEAKVNGFTVITNVTNAAVANTAGSSTTGQTKHGSILDLDIVKECPELRGDSIPMELLRLFTEANKFADDAFFGLLKEEFFSKFEPEY
jgi:uncharacterized protein (TIGR04255 family)